MKTTIIQEVIDPVLNTDDNIDKHIDNLHEIMMTWLFEHSGDFNETIKDSYRETYSSIRDLLINLKPIENLLKTDSYREGLN